MEDIKYKVLMNVIFDSEFEIYFTAGIAVLEVEFCFCFDLFVLFWT